MKEVPDAKIDCGIAACEAETLPTELLRPVTELKLGFKGGLCYIYPFIYPVKKVLHR